MNAEPPAPLQLGKCLTCHVRFVPSDGPCPKCASRSTETYASEGIGTVLASTALENPPAAWPAPHLLAFVEVEDVVRLLVIPDPPLPPMGARVQVRLEAGLFHARTLGDGEAERGEGDVPGAGGTRPSFEPPR